MGIGDTIPDFTFFPAQNLLIFGVNKGDYIMVGFGKNRLIAIKLSKEEQSYILQYCEELTLAIKNKIRHMTDGTIYLMEGESDVLYGGIAYALEYGGMDNKKVSVTLCNLLKRIPFSNELAQYLDRCATQDPNDPLGWKKAQDEIDEEKKTAPDPYRGNLTPQQIARFQDYHWGDTEFPLQFNHSLSIDDVNQSLFFRNSKLFLNKVMEYQNTSILTDQSNLNRKFVKLMFDEMELDEEDRESTLKYNKVINEEDVFPLHIIHIVCGSAGLTHKQSKKLYVYKKLHALLSDEKAGELYYRLFDAFFNKFNLAYLDRLPEMAGLQETIDFSLYSMYRLCDQYQSEEDLFYEVFLPSIINEIEESITSEYFRKEWYLTSRVIRPLEVFGLVECHYEEAPKRSPIVQVRKTPLFNKFMSLNL